MMYDKNKKLRPKNLHRKILDHIDAQGFKIKTLGMYLGRNGDWESAVSVFNDFFTNCQTDKTLRLPRYKAVILTGVFNIPIDWLVGYVDEDFLKLLRPDGVLDALIEPMNSEKNGEKFMKTAISYIEKANDKIWVSEYIPFLEGFRMENQEMVTAWGEAHKKIYTAIESRLKKNSELKYIRIVHLPMGLKKNSLNDIQYNCLAYLKHITLQHMLRVAKEFPNQVIFKTAPATRKLSFAIIDELYLMREHYKNDDLTKPKVIDIDLMTVVGFGNSLNSQNIFNHFLNVFEDLNKNKSSLVRTDAIPQLASDAMQYFERKETNAESDQERQQYERLKNKLNKTLTGMQKRL